MDDLLNCSFDTAFDIVPWKKYFTEHKIINNIKDNE